MDKGAADKDLDNLIFNEKEQNPPGAPATARRSSTDEGDQPVSQNEEEATTGRKSLKFDRSSIANVLPVDKLKNGANTASKVFGSTFSMVKDKTSAAYETAKSSKAGTAIASGISTAAAAGSEQISKVKETDAYKKAASTASSAVEKTTVVASIAAEKAKATASVGLEKAKSGAQSGMDTIKSKVGSSDKKD